MIAHELRTPIQPIIGLTAYVKDKLKDKKHIDLLDSVIASGQKLNTLTENILDISKIEENLFSIKKEPFSRNKSVINNINIFKNLLLEGKKVIQFDFNDFGKEYTLVGDRTRIEQVISNLIHNSIKSISRKEDKEKGQISITIEPKFGTSAQPSNSSERLVLIVIEDNGVGVDPNILQSLCTKFTKSLDGNGLGLYISKKFVEAHDGKIWAENKVNQKGAEFSASIPFYG